MTPAEIIQIVIGVLSLFATVFISFFIYWLQTKHKKDTVDKKVISEEEIEKIIDKVLKSSVNCLLFDDCKVAIMENCTIDWYRKDTGVSKMKVALAEALCKFFNNDRFEAKRQAIQLVDRIIREIKSFEKE
jgi:3-polyprenyl-4-hydroxybenzoate decarboxylase